MNRVICLCAFFLWPLAALAQALIENVQPHPVFLPEGDPWIVEINGVMPDGCPHDLEVSTLSAGAVEVLIARDATQPCTQALTAYRYLADPATHPDWPVEFASDVTLRVAVIDSVSREVLAEETRDLAFGAPLVSQIIRYPLEPGIWESPQAPLQGVLVDSQGDQLVIYPLGYDFGGDPRWSITGGPVVHGVFSGDAIQVRNGPCTGCPTGPPVVVEPVGRVAALMRDSGSMLLQLPGHPALEYTRLDYHRRDTSVPGGLPDLTGEWHAVAQGQLDYGAAPYVAGFVPGSDPARFEVVRNFPQGTTPDNLTSALPERFEVVCEGGDCRCDIQAGSCPGPGLAECDYPVMDIGERYWRVDYSCPTVFFLVMPANVRFHRQDGEIFN